MNNLLTRKICAIALTCTFWHFGSPVQADPQIQDVSGDVVHGATITITGTDFGTKSPAEPAAWDDASGNDLLEVWDGYWPDSSPDPDYDMAYRTPMRGIELPHDHISRYIAGAHGNDNGHNAGYNVILFKNRTIETYPAYTFASWYQRSDDAWTFCGDNNYKVYDFSMGTSPYTFPENWYLEYNPRPTSTTSSAYWHLNDNGSSLTDTTSPWQDQAVNPMSGVWTKIQLEIKWTSETDGYVRVWENGVRRVNYIGATDRYPGSARSEGIGGFARCYGYPSNWRYFADVYLDHSRARVVLADSANYSDANVIEPQIPQSSQWSDGSIQVHVNLGRFQDGDTAYLFVFDPSGQPSSQGFPIEVGGTAHGIAAPASPVAVTAVAE